MNGKLKNGEELLSIQNLRVEYRLEDSRIQAVNDFSITLKKGSVLGLVGETGAGKTTIAKAIMRILPEASAEVKDGSIVFDGQNLLKLKEAEIRKVRGSKIAMIFQDPMTALNPVMTVGEQIEEAIMMHEKINRFEAARKAVEMLKLVNIPEDRARQYPHEFSGGMKQRVVIAMALACKPELLLADEPTTALDVTIQAQVLDLIERQRKEIGTSMILITHDMGIVAETCDEVAVIYAGQVVEYGSKEAVFDHPKHPYTVGLFNSIPRIETKEERLHPIEGMPPDPSDLPEGCYFHPRCKFATDACRCGTVALQKVGGEHFCRCLCAEKED